MAAAPSSSDTLTDEFLPSSYRERKASGGWNIATARYVRVFGCGVKAVIHSERLNRFKLIGLKVGASTKYPERVGPCNLLLRIRYLCFTLQSPALRPILRDNRAPRNSNSTAFSAFCPLNSQGAAD